MIVRSGSRSIVEAMEPKEVSERPSSQSPHDIRSGAITAYPLEDVPVEIEATAT
ncbi:MAG TPA: hypothetical protein VKM69_13085 [Natronoarchaeum rubrum]|nr:hypothetical protein [Natronoarchaeum rubrum]